MNTLDLSKVRETVALMHELGLVSLHIDGFELHLGPGMPWTKPPVAEEAPASEPSPLCGCGHDWHTEHTDAGCLHGCPVTRCERVSPPPTLQAAKEWPARGE